MYYFPLGHVKCMERRADNRQVMGLNPKGGKIIFFQNSICRGIKATKLGLRLDYLSKWSHCTLAMLYCPLGHVKCIRSGIVVACCNSPLSSVECNIASQSLLITRWCKFSHKMGNGLKIGLLDFFSASKWTLERTKLSTNFQYAQITSVLPGRHNYCAFAVHTEMWKFGLKTCHQNTTPFY